MVKLKEILPLGSKDAHVSALEREQRQTLRRQIRFQFGSSMDRVWSPELELAVGTVLVFNAAHQQNDPRLQRPLFFRQYSRRFVTKWAQLPADRQSKPEAIFHAAEDAAREMFGLEKLPESLADEWEWDTTPFGPRRKRRALFFVTSPIRSFTQRSIERAYREGTQNNPRIQRRIFELYLREFLEPSFIKKKFNMDRKGIPKTMEAFLHSRYPDFERKPPAAQQRLRQEFESNLLATMAMSHIQKNEERRFANEKKEHERYVTTPSYARDRKNAYGQGDSIGAAFVRKVEENIVRQRYILSLLERPAFWRWGLRRVAMYFRDEGVFLPAK